MSFGEEQIIVGIQPAMNCCTLVSDASFRAHDRCSTPFFFSLLCLTTCRCDCPIFRTGPACAELLPDAQGVCKAAGLSWDACTGIKQVAPCLNSCNLRGTCVGGFCHCLPGTEAQNRVQFSEAGGLQLRVTHHCYESVYSRLGFPRMMLGFVAVSVIR